VKEKSKKPLNARARERENTLERCRTRKKDRTPEQKNNHLSSSLFEKQAHCAILMQKTRLVSKLHSKNEEKGEAQFRKNRKFAESRSALCPLRSQRPLPPCFARGIGRPIYLFSPPNHSNT